MVFVYNNNILKENIICVILQLLIEKNIRNFKINKTVDMDPQCLEGHKTVPLTDVMKTNKQQPKQTIKTMIQINLNLMMTISKCLENV